MGCRLPYSSPNDCELPVATMSPDGFVDVDFFRASDAINAGRR